jgi:hypothetical protein
MILVRGTLILGLAVGLAGCALVREVEPDPAAIPAGPLEALGGEATGPVVEVGRGRTLGVGWRYSIYQSQDGWCTQLETGTVTSSSCGPLTPEAGVFHGVGFGGASDGPAPLEGMVIPDVAEVWIETSTGDRIETTLMSLAEAGLDGKAFVGFGPENVPVISVTALDADGNVLETFDLPDMP